MIKTLNKLGVERTYLHTIKAMYDKSIANIILNSERLKALLLKSEYSLSSLLFNSTVSSSQSTSQSHLLITCNPCQIPMTFFTEIEKKKS